MEGYSNHRSRNGPYSGFQRRRSHGYNRRGRGNRGGWSRDRHEDPWARGEEGSNDYSNSYTRRDRFSQAETETEGQGRWDRAEGRGGGRGRGRGGRERPPPGLRGREIGMWYAHRSRANTAVMKKPPKLSMDQDEVHAINLAIDGLADSPESFRDAKMRVERKLDGNVKVKTEGNLDLNFPSTSSDSRLDQAVNDRLKEKVVVKTEEELDCFDNPEMFQARNTKEEDNNYDIRNVLDRIQESDFKNAYQENIEANKRRDNDGLQEMAKNITSRLSRDPKVDQDLYEELLQKDTNAKYREMIKVRNNLPSFQMRDKILDVIRENQVVVLSGETGCGKTTQVAQFVLDDCIQRKEGSTCRIVCTQPRRISAISVAERVAEERGERLGNSVGYQIRLESTLPRTQGSVLYCTTGIILQWLQSDPLLSSVSHLVLDEIHERDSLSDFLICISKDLVPLRPDLKVILMSATLNAEHFSKFFYDCPMIHIPGFTYPVDEFYLEDVLELTKFSFPADKKSYQPWKHRRGDDASKQREWEDFILPHLRELENSGKYSGRVIRELEKQSSEELCLDLVLALLKHISSLPPGAVLVFVPGWDQISKLDKLIQGDHFFSPSKYLVIPLHSLMPTVNQKEIFKRPKQGVRKIVIATNIAETSITIDDIVYVVDGGKIKMKNYDKETNISTLLPEWVTLANAKQRRGRAGRVQKGICYHLYTKARELMLQPFPLPEIQRTRLEEVILQVKSLRLGSSKAFLSKVLDPPEEGVIDVSLKMLRVINALDEEENLTPLGFHLGRLPMDPLTGKMLLMGAIFSCLSPILTVAASLSFKDPFVMVLGKEKEVDECRLKHSYDTKSDHLMLVNVFNQWQKTSGPNKNRFVWDNFLSHNILNQLKNMRQQFTDTLRDHKFINTRNPDAEEINLNSDNINLVKAVITAGLYPNVARILKKEKGKFHGKIRGITLPDVKRVAIHPKSVNEKEKYFESSWFVYWEKIKTAKVYLYDTTMVSNYPLLLFGEKVQYDEKENVIDVDGFVKVRCDKQVADVIQKLRKELDGLLEYKITHPGVTDWREGSKERRLLSLIVEMLSSEKDTSDGVYSGYQDNGDDDDDDEII